VPIHDRWLRDEGNALAARWQEMLTRDSFPHLRREIEEASHRCDIPALKALDLAVFSAWNTMIENWRGFYRDHLNRRMKEVRAQAEEHLKKNDYERAIKAYETMQAFGVEPALEESNRELSRLAQTHRAYREELDRLAKSEPELIRSTWEAACKEAPRNLDAAVGVLKGASLKLPASVESMTELIRDMELAASVPKDVGKELAPEKTIAAYASAKKSVPAADQTRALFFYALHSLEARTAEREFLKLQKAGVKLRSEYEELYLKVQKDAEAIRGKRLEAEAKLRKADQDDNQPKTLDNAIKLYEELLKSYTDVLTEKQIASITKRLEELARGKSETILDAKDLPIKGKVTRAVNDKCPLKDVVIVDDGNGPDAESYAEIEFEAKADTPYKLWLFMGFLSTDTNSVQVMFEGDVEISGAIGDDRGEREYCVQYFPRGDELGFGWCDRDMRARNGAERAIDLNTSPGPTFKYKTAGKKKIRLHEGEGGCPVARVLISSQKFLRAIPGAAETQPRKP
jgi:hypothetical protein